MMKKLVLLLAIMFCCSTMAQAAVFRPYLAFKGKVALTNNQVEVVHRDEVKKYHHDIKVNETIPGFSAAYGVMLPFDYQSIRAEVEYSHNWKAKKQVQAQKSAPMIDASVQTKAVFFNMYYDFKSNSAWVPYIGGGIGGSKLETQISKKSSDKTTLAWNAGLGLLYRMNRHYAIDFGYRYVYYGSYSRHTDDTYQYLEDDDVKAASHELFAGLRITW